MTLAKDLFAALGMVVFFAWLFFAASVLDHAHEVESGTRVCGFNAGDCG